MGYLNELNSKLKIKDETKPEDYQYYSESDPINFMAKHVNPVLDKVNPMIEERFPLLQKMQIPQISRGERIDQFNEAFDPENLASGIGMGSIKKVMSLNRGQVIPFPDETEILFRKAVKNPGGMEDKTFDATVEALQEIDPRAAGKLMQTYRATNTAQRGLDRARRESSGYDEYVDAAEDMAYRDNMFDQLKKLLNQGK